MTTPSAPAAPPAAPAGAPVPASPPPPPPPKLASPVAPLDDDALGEEPCLKPPLPDALVAPPEPLEPPLWTKVPSPLAGPSIYPPPPAPYTSWSADVCSPST